MFLLLKLITTANHVKLCEKLITNVQNMHSNLIHESINEKLIYLIM